MPSGQMLYPADDQDCQVLEVRFTLGIPRGQDLLVGDGQGLDHEIEPQRVVGADGNTYWRLPGASLRGMFHAWVARLAAREGKPVADNVQRHIERETRVRKGERLPKEEQLNGDNLGWCFLPNGDRRHGKAENGLPRCQRSSAACFKPGGCISPTPTRSAHGCRRGRRFPKSSFESTSP